tara:strand:- start:164 stop:352 length:189 start_codon:yes stop_codon:yes gene_type:complete
MSIQKDFWYKLEDSLYDKEEEERIQRYEKKESKYKQLEFNFEEDQVSNITKIIEKDTHDLSR